jgi:alanine racemase
MTLTLYVDGPRWRAHLTSTAADNPGIVPVAKGNGYGFGVARLARRTEWLGCDTIAVGTYSEVADVERRFSGSILVMQPWRPFLAEHRGDARIIHTVGRLDDLVTLGRREDRPRVVLEALTSMRRHGFAVADLEAARRAARGVRVEGHAMHLPLGGGHLAEAERWLEAAPAQRWFVSHLGLDELAELRRRHPDTQFRPRVGTALWLGDRDALRPRSAVLDVHPVRRGDRVGYRQRRITRNGQLLVVAGGTAHGIALEAPAPAASPRQRAVSLARGGLDATGRSLSPFVVDGRRRWFVEPPHMQVSMIFVPSGASMPDVGDELAVQVRHTTTTFDQVIVS